MPQILTSFPLVTALVFVAAAPLSAQLQDRELRRLEHEDYEIWNRIGAQSLSNDGRWALFTTVSERNDGALTVVDLDGQVRHVVERAESPLFDDASRFVAFTIKPAKAALDEARRTRTPSARMPADTLGILDLATGAVDRVARLRNFRLPAEAGGWIAYQLGRAPAEKSDSAAPAPGAVQPRAPEQGRMPEPPVGEPRTGEPGADSAKAAPERKRDEGYPLIVLNIVTREERRIEDVVAYEFTRDGARLVFSRSNKAGDADGVYVLETATGAIVTLLAGKGEYKQIATDEAGRQIAFLSNVDEFADSMPSWKLYHWDAGSRNARTAGARVVATASSTGIPSGSWIADNGSVRFSPNGQRLFFGTAPRPQPEPAKPDDGEDRVVVDIWNWQDPLLQPMQLRRADDERRRTYDAVLHIRDNRIVQLERPDIPDVTVALRGDGDIALGTSDLPYRREISWGASGDDVYLVDVRSGAATRVMEYNRGNVSLSPDAHFITWFDGDALAWFAMNVRTRDIVNISAAIPTAVHNELHDSPSLPSAYGNAGWTTRDERFLVYDRHDIWAVDPSGRAAPRNITDGVGRRDNVRFRHVRLDPDERAIDPSADLLLTAFNLRTKAAGFYRDRVNGAELPAQIVSADKRFGAPRKARDAGRLLYTRSDFREFPDLWVADAAFANARRISDANPQQAGYRWGTAELVEWLSGDGESLQGVLYKPDGFDPSRKYPMMVYFYERLSDNLHGYVAPAAGSSSINISFYVSRGYLVFTPDIPYRIGYPGESAFKSVVPGVLSLLSRGYVDEDRVGVQGHSWGGYQIAYLITKTDIFRAAEAGAPVANMVSAYGGIRWESGMSRMFQYERTQSRLGGTLWESPMRFIENSPIFWADKVNTPLLMMHNDEDGAVPWEQGIEYFVALRRLDKPVWMLNYNGEAHGLRKEVNRKDWTIRMQQFFDYYLLGASPPVWLVKGVPATEKGRNLGLDLVTTTTDRPATDH